MRDVFTFLLSLSTWLNINYSLGCKTLTSIYLVFIHERHFQQDKNKMMFSMRLNHLGERVWKENHREMDFKCLNVLFYLFFCNF